MPEADRTLGMVVQGIADLQKTMERVLDGQEESRRAADKHSESDLQNFQVIREGIGGLRDRIARLEAISDTVESHGDALNDIEQRLANQEDNQKVALAVRANNRQLVKWMIGISAAAAGDAAGQLGIFGRIGKWFASTMK